jgi:hypothetical protein
MGSIELGPGKGTVLMLLAALGGCSGGAGGGGEGPLNPPETQGANFVIGDVVAELEVAAPADNEFILHGTVPLPPGMYVPGTTLSPFTLRAPGLGTTTTQVEVVSRYPSAAEGADVVEIIARVNKIPGTPTGTRLVYNVIWSPTTIGTRQLNDDVQALLDTPNSLVVRSSDVFAHRYEADILSDLRNNTSDLRTIKDGQLAHQVRTYENLDPVTPVTGGTGTLPHQMGVHAYVTAWDSEEFFAVDLRFHNGHEGFDPDTEADDPVGKLYFNELELVVPAGWKVFQAYETPSSGILYTEGATEVFPLVTAVPGELHMMAIQAQFHRRLIVCKAGAEEQAQAVLAGAGMAFCRDGENVNEERLMSWWNPATARYWGQNLPLPTLGYLNTRPNMRADLEVEFDGLDQNLANGTPGDWPNLAGNMGWSHPAGLNVGYAHGGHHIVWWDGLDATWSASLEGYRSFEILHRMYTERHPTALYAKNGNPYQLEKWLLQGANGPYLPTYIWTIPWLPLADPHGFTTAPTFQIDAVADQGRKPSYENALLNYQWIDTSHLIRATRCSKVLVWVGNDALAKDDLRMQAEISRSSWAPYPQKDNGDAIVTGLWVDMEFMQEHPSDGVPMDRQEGWVIDTAACYYGVADDTWRSEAMPWFKSITDTVFSGQSACSGIIMATPHGTHLGGNYRLIQTVSEAVIQNGLWGVRTSVFDREEDEYADRIDHVLRRSTAAMISSLVWNPAKSNFHFYTALGPYDQDEPSFCGYMPPDGHSEEDGWQTWNVLTFGYLLTGNLDFLTKATLMGGGTLTQEGIGNDTWAGELEVRAGMVGLIQNYLTP